MKKLLIFGIKDLAELAWYYFTTDSEYVVAGFVVTTDFLPIDPIFHGLPVLSLDEVVVHYPSNEYDFFVPMTNQNCNKERERIYLLVKGKGYSFATYISSKATVFDRENIGENCFILEGSIIQPFAHVGVNTIIWGGFVGHHSMLKDHIFMCHASLCGHCLVENHCFIGTGSAVAEGVTLRQGSFIAMNSSVIMDTVEWGMYLGSPALLQRKLL